MTSIVSLFATNVLLIVTSPSAPTDVELQNPWAVPAPAVVNSVEIKDSYSLINTPFVVKDPNLEIDPLIFDLDIENYHLAPY